ncbi:hypothetical protein [Sutcliffiella halmapala]|uniref:hypothetical protein n=1 Tax=Sutcliffiella halmapala TaxID=79882 RepID=UPI001474C743|nr:hypothetical protein [Sutcliffiella halmapala]
MVQKNLSEEDIQMLKKIATEQGEEIKELSYAMADAFNRVSEWPMKVKEINYD